MACKRKPTFTVASQVPIAAHIAFYELVYNAGGQANKKGKGSDIPPTSASALARLAPTHTESDGQPFRGSIGPARESDSPGDKLP
jgi:hypothetical protein